MIDDDVNVLIAERNRLQRALDFIATVAGGFGELYPVGATDVVYGDDGNTVVEYVKPWLFLRGEGDTFLDAVEAEMLATEQDRKNSER
jgi:hypothetical protein